jgi:hypothetical protein
MLHTLEKELIEADDTKAQLFRERAYGSLLSC